MIFIAIIVHDCILKVHQFGNYPIYWVKGACGLTDKTKEFTRKC